MKREEEEEEVEVLVSVDEEEACEPDTDTRHQDLSSVLIRPLPQGWGLHLLVKHLNCSRLSHCVLKIPEKTFFKVLRTCFSICVLLSLLRIECEHFMGSCVTLFVLAVHLVLDYALLFAILAAVVLLKLERRMKHRMKDAIPAVSAAVHQV